MTDIEDIVGFKSGAFDNADKRRLHDAGLTHPKLRDFVIDLVKFKHYNLKSKIIQTCNLDV